MPVYASTCPTCGSAITAYGARLTAADLTCLRCPPELPAVVQHAIRLAVSTTLTVDDIVSRPTERSVDYHGERRTWNSVVVPHANPPDGRVPWVRFSPSGEPRRGTASWTAFEFRQLFPLLEQALGELARHAPPVRELDAAEAGLPVIQRWPRRSR